MNKTSKPWDGSASRFTDEQYQRSCLIDRGGDAPVKERCSLPVLEPDGTVNTNALAAAAAALAGGRGGVKNVPPEKAAAAKAKLRSLYKQAGMDPPESLAGKRSRIAIDDTYFDLLAERPTKRTARFDDLEISEHGDGFRFEGHAAVFDEVADIGEFTESIERGAFRKVLQNGGNIPFTIEHDPTRVLATTGSGRLRLAEDVKGLGVEADLPDTSHARDLRELWRSGVVRGMSFGFKLAGRKDFQVEWRNGGKPHRKLLGFKQLLDVCSTWDPTYQTAQGQFRSAFLLEHANSDDGMQQLLLGAYPQLGSGASVTDTTEEDNPDDPALDETPEETGDGETARVNEEGISLAAARNRLLLMQLDLEGDLI